MPFIHTMSSTAISPEQEKAMKARMGKAISIIPGKSEGWLMLGFEDSCHLYFKGSNELPSAFIEVKLFGKASADAYERLTAELTEIVSSELGIPSDRIYVKYEEVSCWGFNGRNF